LIKKLFLGVFIFILILNIFGDEIETAIDTSKPSEKNDSGKAIKPSEDYIRTGNTGEDSEEILTAILKSSDISNELEPVYTEIPPVIDGKLDDVCWEKAKSNNKSSIYTFYYRDIEPSTQAYEPTDAFVSYDREHLYVALVCYREDINREMTSDVLIRDDSLWMDDHIQVILDTNHDKSSAYYYAVNPENIQMDGFVARNGEVENRNWDAVWESSTSIDYENNLWIVELSIPFRNMRFSLNDEMTWGFNIFRLDKYYGEQTMWVNSGGDVYNISNYGNIKFSREINKNPTLDIKPYFSINMNQDDEYEWNEFEDGLKFGLDISSRIIPSLIFSGTYKPDFAQIESDTEYINLEPEEELYYPEKREFFLEGQEHFNQPLMLFYSRRIGDIDYGGKVNFNLSKTSLYALNVFASNSSEDNRMDNPPKYNFSVLRVNQDIIPDWSIGGTFLQRKGLDTYNRGYGIDSTISVKDYFVVDTQFAMMEDTNISNKPKLFHISAYRYTSGLSFYGGYEDIPPGFSNLEMGYIPLDDIKGAWLEMDYNIWLYKKGIQNLNFYAYSDRYKGHEDGNPDYERWTTMGEFGVELENKLEFAFNYERNLRTWYEEKYKNYYYEIFTGYKMLEWSTSYIDYIYGEHYNSKLHYLALSTSLKLHPRIGLELSLEYERLEPKEEPDDLENIWIWVFKTKYQITNRLFFRSFVQYSGFSIPERWTFNGLIGYNYLPGSYIYLVYNENRDKNQSGDYPAVSREIFFKTTYWLGL
jgi:hypothetical protein